MLNSFGSVYRIQTGHVQHWCQSGHWTHCLFMHMRLELSSLYLTCTCGAFCTDVGAPAFSWILLFLLQRHGFLEHAVFCGLKFSPVLKLVQSVIVFSMECETKKTERKFAMLPISTCHPQWPWAFFLTLAAMPLVFGQKDLSGSSIFNIYISSLSIAPEDWYWNSFGISRYLCWY